MIDSVAGGAGLFGLVNNAGICVVGPVECLNISEWKNQFDVNFFGLIAVTQAMLPLLRRYSQTHRSSIPRIVNISSVTGTVPTPLFGAYCASKAAVESISDTLRRELHEHNIGVGMIIPGTIQTEIWRKEKAGAEAIAARPDCRGLYSRLIDHVAAYVFRTAEKAKPAENVAIAIERALKRKTPPIRTLVAWESHVGVNVRRFMPDRIFDFLMLRTFGLNGTQEKITAESGDHRDELTHDPFVR
jgi:short-subunit dehydrogenase